VYVDTSKGRCPSFYLRNVVHPMISAYIKPVKRKLHFSLSARFCLLQERFFVNSRGMRFSLAVSESQQPVVKNAPPIDRWRKTVLIWAELGEPTEALLIMKNGAVKRLSTATEILAMLISLWEWDWLYVNM